MTITVLRFYSAALGRWVNRDPIGEWGGFNLFAFVRNSPVYKNDLLGLIDLSSFSCSELRDAHARNTGGQELVMTVAQEGRPDELNDAVEAGTAKVATPYTGSDNPIIDAFEASWVETGLSLGVHVVGQIANAVDGLVLEQPGNFYNYWGMIEIWRHQRLIDQIENELENRTERRCGCEEH